MLTQEERQRSGPTKGLGDGGAIGSKIGESYAGDKTEDKLFGEAADVKESSTNSGQRGRK